MGVSPYFLSLLLNLSPHGQSLVQFNPSLSQGQQITNLRCPPCVGTPSPPTPPPPVEPPSVRRRTKRWLRIALVVVVAGSVVASGASFAHFVARKTIPHVQLWESQLGGPEYNKSNFPPGTYDFCLPVSGLRAGTAWFSWGVVGGSGYGEVVPADAVLLVLTGPVPVNATVYNSTNFAVAGSGSFPVHLYGDTNCGSYSFRMYITIDNPPLVDIQGTWNYTTSGPFI